MNTNPPFERDAQLFLSMGHFQQALIVASKWVEARADDSFGWFCRSVAELALGRADLALRSIDKALDLDADSGRYRSHRARCLIAIGRTTEGLELVRDLAGQDHRDPQLLDAIATTLASAGETAEAIPVMEKAIALNPKVAQFHTNYASMLNFCGRRAESEAAHREALKLQPQDFQAYWLLSQLTKATSQNNDLDWFRSALETYKNNMHAQIGINYALGKQLEDLGRYDEAFEHYRQGAAAVLQHTPHNRSAVENQFRNYKEAFDTALFETEIDGHDNDEAIFIVGMPRTGTTLVERIIASYDGVFAAGELHNFNQLFNRFCDRLSPGNPGVVPANIASLDFAELGRAYIASTRPRTGQARYFIDKYPFNFRLLGPIALALPGAKIICLNRNPMDTCFSNFKFLFNLGSASYSYDQESLAHYYAEYCGLMSHWRQCLPGRILDVDYDELVKNPEQAARRISDFLGFQWDPRCLEFHENSGVVSTGSAAQIREPLNSAYLDRWKKFAAHLEPLKEALGE